MDQHSIGAHSREERIREKYREDQRHIKYLFSKGWRPLDIADHMIQYMIDLLRETEKKVHPKWTEPQILEEMRKKILISAPTQKKRGLR
jgi:hypothetical protein